MADETAPKTLRDYFTLQRGTTYKSRLLDLPGPVLLGLASIERNGGFKSSSLRTYGGECPESLIVSPGELYLSLKDVTQSADLLGAVARLPEDHPPGRLTQDTVKLQPLHADVPLDYLYWLLRTPEYRGYCYAHATGTTNLGLARDDFLAFPVPELTDKRAAIVAVLMSVERKIELNRRMNTTLEAIAHALFKSWFVDFEPVRAKVEGRTPDLPRNLSALFPDSVDEDEKPLGWETKTWGQIATLEYGKRLTGYEAADGDFPVYGTNGPIGSHHEALYPNPGIIIGRKGAYRGVFYSDRPFFVIDTAFYLKPFSKMSSRWAYYEILRHPINDMDSGSAIPSTSRDSFYTLPVLLPPFALQSAYEELMHPVWRAQTVNEEQNSTLAALRDTLLPRLVSGELRVKDAETFLERTL